MIPFDSPLTDGRLAQGGPFDSLASLWLVQGRLVDGRLLHVAFLSDTGTESPV